MSRWLHTIKKKQSSPQRGVVARVPPLPYELWDDIVARALRNFFEDLPKPVYGLPSPARQYLKNLCLVNKTLRSVATARLYSSVVLRTAEQLKMLYIQLLRTPQLTERLHTLCLFGDAASHCPKNIPTLIAFFNLPGLHNNLNNLVLDRASCTHYPQCWEVTERFRNAISPVLHSLQELVLLGHNHITSLGASTDIEPHPMRYDEHTSTLVSMSSFMHWQHFHSLQRLLLYRASANALLVSFLSALPQLTHLVLVNSDVLTKPHPDAEFLEYVKAGQRGNLRRLVVLTPTNTWKVFIRALSEVASAAGEGLEVGLLHPAGLWDRGGVSIIEKLQWVRERVVNGSIWNIRTIPIAP